MRSHKASELARMPARRGRGPETARTPFDEEGLTCSLCGLGPGETDFTTGLLAKLYVGHPGGIDVSGDSAPVGRIICSICVEGRKEMFAERFESIEILS